jgi:hypothetical protein
MPRDKQLKKIKLSDVLEKRELDQALNAKEFAVLAGISYSTARQWFRSHGFPVVRSPGTSEIRGFVFWKDFVRWRNSRHGSAEDRQEAPDLRDAGNAEKKPQNLKDQDLPLQAAQILQEAS